MGFFALFLDLSAAVDVYSDWVDACDAVAKDEPVRNPGLGPRGRPAEGSPGIAEQPLEPVELGEGDDY